MSIPTNKESLKQAIFENYQKLRTELNSVPLHLAKQKNLEGHAKQTRMSVCNLVSYLIGWGQLILKWNEAKEKGLHVDFPETGYKWNELGKLAQKFYDDYDSQTYPQLIHALDRTVEDILNLIDKKTNAQLYQTPWYKDWTQGRLIQLNTASPYNNARLRVRKWKKENALV
jgi:hypothetical protein